MAGLWELIKQDATERVNTHLVVAGIKGFAAGVFTAQQVIDALDRTLGLNGYSPLTAAAKTDLSNIAAQITALGTVTLKLTYVVCKLEPVMIAGETGSCTEAFWRSALGIA